MGYPYDPLLHDPPRRHRRPGTSFAAVNGATFAVHLLLACFAEEFLATRVWGQTTVGALALFAQGVLLVWTAVRYDRHEDADRTPQVPTPSAATPEQKPEQPGWEW